MAVEVSQGVCDLCGAPSDASLQECNWLTCTFQHCEGGLYHQECLEKYLKSNKLEKNRKTGFKCPRGCGKGTRFDQACPGRIDKSHPIHPRNEDKKKTKLAAVVVEPQRPAKAAVPVAQNGKAGKTKEEAKADAGKDAKGTAANKAAPGAKASAPVAAAAPTPVVPQKSGRKEVTLLPPRPEVVAKQKLAELAAQARREIGLPTGTLTTSGSKGDLQGLAGSTGPSKVVSTSAASAWGKPSLPAVEPPAVSPQPPMMSQLPQLQQLLQQAASKKAAAKPAPPTSAAPAASKPAPAVPQPVLNPPTPVWPALGATQSSAAALLAASSSQSRESVARPASPPSAWASPAVAPTPAQQQATQPPSPPPQQASSAAASRPPSSSGASTSAAAAAAPAASAPSPPPASPSTAGPSGTTAAVPSVPPGFGTSFGPGQGSAVEGGAEPSSSGRSGAASDTTQAAASQSAAATLPVSASSRSVSQLVGADFVDDEAKEPKLTKAQKKNLKRTEKKKVPAGSPGEQRQGSSGDGDQEAAETSRRGSESGANGPPPHPPSTGPASTRQTQAGAASVSGSGTHKRQESRGSEDPEQAHLAAAEDAAVMEELCINCIVGRKVLALITQLQRLGALEFVAAAAVQRHGSNLLAALEWLLVAGADAASAPPEIVLAAAADSTSAAESEVDITEELQQLSDLQSNMGLPTELLQQCVLECNGDVQAAATSAVERMRAAPPCSSSGAAGRSSSGSGASPAARHGTSGMQQSASFYSVSSLDPAAGGQDVDCQRPPQALQPQQHSQPQQQPAHSRHFGVRLQDEPADSGSAGGYGDPCAYVAGLMRGGAVIGAAGWQSGYLPPGISVAAPSSGRSTSRLRDWLRDDSGRAAALEE
ncbi:hypothetical protein Agub_g1904, partial [Astrephomene gubernaculifera]